MTDYLRIEIEASDLFMKDNSGRVTVWRGDEYLGDLAVKEATTKIAYCDIPSVTLVLDAESVGATRTFVPSVGLGEKKKEESLSSTIVSGSGGCG